MISNRTILCIFILGSLYTCTCATVPDAWALPPEMEADPAALTRKPQWAPGRAPLRNMAARSAADNPCSLPSALRPPGCDWWLVHRYARSGRLPASQQDRGNFGARRSSLSLNYLLGVPSFYPSRRSTAQRPGYFRHDM